MDSMAESYGVLRSIARGMTAAEVGRELKIETRTVSG
jgi:DNA-binding NarL/FixJ family response regulator